jgi:hypothetical protein
LLLRRRRSSSDARITLLSISMLCAMHSACDCVERDENSHLLFVSHRLRFGETWRKVSYFCLLDSVRISKTHLLVFLSPLLHVMPHHKITQIPFFA